MAKLKPPEPASRPHRLFEPIHGKTASVQIFKSARTGEHYDYVVFHARAAGCVSIFALDIDEHVIAVRQYRHGAARFSLEFPGGLCQKGQKEEDAVLAELGEETGYFPTGMIRRLADRIYFDPASFDFFFAPYLATGCIEIGSQQQDEAENIEVVKMPIGKWIEEIRKGGVQDAKTIATTHLALEALKI